MTIIKPPLVESDRDIRKDEILLAISGTSVEIIDRNQPYGAEPVFAPDGSTVVIRVPRPVAAEFARSIYEAFDQVGVQAPSTNGQIKAMQQHLQDMRAIAMRVVEDKS